MSDLLIERQGGVVFVTLNRPAALNALNFNIVRGLHALLDEVAQDDDIRCIFISGAGDRAFCAGGDIKAAREAGLAWQAGQVQFADVLQFFDEEYALNRRMFHFEKPLVALLNGITMGGGVGVAGACRYRIATEKTVWAMPEVTIGFFPDVGAGYYLTGTPGMTGRYLGLTGQSVSNPADLLDCAFITHYMPSEACDDLRLRLASGADVTASIESFAVTPQQTVSLPHAAIDRHFAHDTVEKILASLDAGDDWARATAALMRTKSPTSLKVTLHHLQLSAEDKFDHVSHRDLLLAEYFLRGYDLYEGIRAAVVDKDRQPKWKPSRLEDVTVQEVLSYFKAA